MGGGTDEETRIVDLGSGRGYGFLARISEGVYRTYFSRNLFRWKSESSVLDEVIGTLAPESGHGAAALEEELPLCLHGAW